MLGTIEGRKTSRIFAGVMIALLAGCGGGSGGSPGGSVSITTPTPAPAPSPGPVTPPPSTAAGFADLTWTAPTQNEDGSPLTNLAGYKIRYGQSTGGLTQTVDIGSPSTNTVHIDGLAAGTWYFTVASYTNTGVESAPAGPVTKTIL
jgi:hypothetical protein